ncbi:M14 family metallopeptidase [Pseudofulvibacter geojedonensis]|uniref:M14 family metallopeptidase n=1 Tax=Pseudofulvibacter geojedonensis TaxID=1123758 RepID=A0ABW3I502_9FLAO
MKKLLLLLFIILLACQQPIEENSSYDFKTTFEKSNGTETATYNEIITFYKELAKKHSTISIDSIGKTDSGRPLHYITYQPNNNTKNTILINNGIHPGESDGIDATMMLFRDFAQGKIESPEKTKIVTIPVYNVGGCLNRNTGTRTNQNGPKEYGFRGNARNYDLNRDFIKSDTKNAKAFAKLFHRLKPDVFIDNHVSNGADYQYTLTHLFTQHNKLNGPLGEFLNKTMMPEVEKSLAKKNIDITPYVNVWGTTPESGWSQFMDYPRYSTGYTTLFDCLGLMVETHMLKPYKDRVLQTYELNKSVIEFTNQFSKEITEQQFRQYNFLDKVNRYAIDWEIDSTKITQLNFKGYEASYPTSKITGKKRLLYNRKKPYTKTVSYYNNFKPKNSVYIPKSYVIPHSWSNVIELLNINHIALTPIKKDTIITVTSYKIDAYQTRQSPYEGHYQHYNTTVKSSKENIQFRKGDFIVQLTPENLRYLIETLEPEAPDSFFNWNFFDTILQQKEHFSAYVFEDKAVEILNNDLDLKKKFENRKRTDSSFSNNPYAQLDWIHKHSNHYETNHMQYPIYRIE